MGKKQFIALADHLRGINVPEEVLAALVSFMRSENPAFKESRWRDYLKGECGPNGGKIREN